MYFFQKIETTMGTGKRVPAILAHQRSAVASFPIVPSDAHLPRLPQDHRSMADCCDLSAAFAQVTTPPHRFACPSEPPRVLRERSVFPLRVGPKLPSLDDDSDDEDVDVPKRCPESDADTACVRRADPVFRRAA
jgi:hypothetical protein